MDRLLIWDGAIKVNQSDPSLRQLTFPPRATPEDDHAPSPTPRLGGHRVARRCTRADSLQG